MDFIFISLFVRIFGCFCFLLVLFYIKLSICVYTFGRYVGLLWFVCVCLCVCLLLVFFINLYTRTVYLYLYLSTVRGYDGLFVCLRACLRSCFLDLEIKKLWCSKQIPSAQITSHTHKMTIKFGQIFQISLDTKLGYIV